MKICFFGAYDKNFTSNRIIIDGLRQNGVKVVEVNAHVKLTRLDRSEDMTWWKLILRVIRKYRLLSETLRHLDDIRSSDAIYVGFPGHLEVFPAFLIAKVFHKKLVFNPLVVIYTGYAHDHTILKRGSFLAQMIKKAEKLAYTVPDIVLADTPFQKEHICSEFGIKSEKVGVLPIGADDKVYPYSPKKRGDGVFNVTYYGLYTPLHGVQHIVEAARILKDRKDIVFSMVGNGNTFDENYNKAEGLKLTNIRFFKDMTEENAFDTLAEADVFLGFLQKHPTVDRAIPNKVYQGLALGKTVISADAKVIRSVFTHKENVFLCAPSSGKSLAEAILYLRDHPALTQKLARNGHKMYKQQFTPKMIGSKLAKIVGTIM